MKTCGPWSARCRALLVSVLVPVLFATHLPAEEVSIPIPNHDFESSANAGSLGSFTLFGLPNYSASAIPLAGGPWEARTFGIAGLIAAPELTISPNGAANGFCRISALAMVNLLNLGLLANRAFVSQTLQETGEAYTLYTLEADVDSSSALSLTALARAGVGIGLTIGGTQVASSLTSTGEFLSLELLSATRYRLKLRYATGETPPAGRIGIRLFAGEGSGLVQASVLTEVVFDNVSLTAFKLES